MKTKDKSVNIKDLQPIFAKHLNSIEYTIRVVEGGNYQMTITSGKDGKHMQGSKHYKGLAIDIRCRDMRNVNEVVHALKGAFDKTFDIVFESDHIHIEYDPK